VYNTRDNIVALATIPGRSALSVIRCSGDSCVLLYKALFKEKKISAPNFVHLKQAYSKDLVIDQCMVTFFKGPKSYTGENMLEISTHGGSVIALKIIQLIESNRFRPAHPGEFTYRAFVNGKLDLAQAESVQTIIDSRNSLDSLYSVKNVQGHFSNQVFSTKNKIKRILSYMEHELDFNEDEIDFKTHKNYIEKIKKAENSVANLLESSYLTKQNKSSVVIALAGKTNVGKSSLFNKILGYDRSIVTRMQGTTRDTVEAEIIINNINVRIVDTAGIRKTKEIIEKKGISKTFEAIKSSDLVLFVDDLSPKKCIKSFPKIFKNKKILYVKSKSDLARHVNEKGSFNVSSKEGKGVAALLKNITKEIDSFMQAFLDSNFFLINIRQKNILINTLHLLKDSLSSYKQTGDAAIASSFLRSAHNKLSEIQGYSDKDEIINNIFQGFCVGK